MRPSSCRPAVVIGSSGSAGTRSVRRWGRTGIRAIIQHGMDQGVFKKGDPKMIEFAMMGAVNWIAKWFNPEGEMSSDQIGETFADYLVGGLLKKQLR